MHGLGWHSDERWSVELEAFNLLDRQDSDTEYLYTSRISPGATPRDEVHFHPVEPSGVRARVTARF